MIHTAETYFRRRLAREKVPPSMAAHLDRDVDREELKRRPDLPGVRAQSRVNHGRWIVDCPFCNGAQFAAPSDRRFLCADCDNLGQGWVAVEFPAAPRMAQIEELLSRRPRVENMNWLPGESVADLRRENVEHGVPEPGES